MSQGVSEYPICEFLNRLVEEFGPSRSEFVQAGLGYCNIERGLRRLEPLENGDGFYLIITQIKKRFSDATGVGSAGARR